MRHHLFAIFVLLVPVSTAGGSPRVRAHAARAVTTVTQQKPALLRRSLKVEGRAGIVQGRVITESVTGEHGEPVITGNDSYDKHLFPRPIAVHSADEFLLLPLTGEATFELVSGHRILASRITDLRSTDGHALAIEAYAFGFNPATCCYDAKTPLLWSSRARLSFLAANPEAADLAMFAARSVRDDSTLAETIERLAGRIRLQPAEQKWIDPDTQVTMWRQPTFDSPVLHLDIPLIQAASVVFNIAPGINVGAHVETELDTAKAAVQPTSD